MTMPVTTVVRVHPSSNSVTVSSTLNNIHLWDGSGNQRQWFARCTVDDVAPAVPSRFTSQTAFWQAVKEPLMQGVQRNAPHFAVVVAGAKHSGKSFTLFGDWVGDAKLSAAPLEEDGILMRFYDELLSQESAVEAVDVAMVVLIHEIAYDLLDASRSYHFQNDLTTHPICGSQFNQQKWITCTTAEDAANALRTGLINFGHVLLEHMSANAPVQLFVFNRIWKSSHVLHYTFAELDLRHAEDQIFEEDHLTYQAKVGLSGRALLNTARSLASNESEDEWQLACSGGVASYLLLPSLSSGSFMAITCVNGKTEQYHDNCMALDFMTQLGADRTARAMQVPLERASLVKDIKQACAKLTAAHAICKQALDSLMARSLQNHKHLQQLGTKALSSLFEHLVESGFLMTDHGDNTAAPRFRLLIDNNLASSMLVELCQLSTVLGTSSASVKDDEGQVRLCGIGVLDRHVRVTRLRNKLELTPFEDAICFVNGDAVASDSATELKGGDVVLLGMHTLFLVIDSQLPLEDKNTQQAAPQPSQKLNWTTALEKIASSAVSTIDGAWREYRKELHHLKIDRAMAATQKRTHSDAQLSEGPPNPKQSLGLMHARVPPTALPELVFGVRMANFISAQMARSMAFKVATVTASDEVGDGDSGNHNDVAAAKPGCGMFYVHAAVLDPQSGQVRSSALWSPAKWSNRLSMITRMYKEYLRLDDTYKLEELYPEHLSPFRERPGHELVGVAFLHLNPFMYLLDVRDSLPVMDFNGAPAGYLTINGRAWIDEIEPNPTYLTVDKEASLMDFLGRNLILKLFFESLQGLPEQCCQHVYVSFRFLFHRQAYSTPMASGHTSNPHLDAVICINQRITADVLAYVERGAIELEVWARRSESALPEDSHLVGDAQQKFNKVQPDGSASNLNNRPHGAASAGVTRASLAINDNPGGDRSNRGGPRMSMISAQQKNLQLRMNIQEHERAAALLAVQHAEGRLHTLALENASLLQELEAMRHQAAILATDEAELEPSSRRPILSKICSIS